MKKILIIDDNEQDRKIMKRYFLNAGFEQILEAATGEKGVETVKMEKPDIVILDTLLPQMDGFEACRQIRKNCGPDTPKIVILTGYVDAVDALKAREMGADEYCVKTSDLSELIKAVENLPKLGGKE